MFNFKEKNVSEAWHCHKNRQADKQNRIKKPVNKMSKLCTLNFWERIEKHAMEKRTA